MLGSQRLIVRRTRLLGAQAELWPDWRHHAFLTNRTDAIELVEAEHRQHAVVELAIRDLKDQGLAHFPSGKFLANAAWTVIAALAHNLLRWTTLIGLPDTTIPTARTLRRRLLSVPGRITRTARTVTLRMPARWPWATQFLTTLERLRAVPAADLTHDRGHDDDRLRTLGVGLPAHTPTAPPATASTGATHTSELHAGPDHAPKPADQTSKTRSKRQLRQHHPRNGGSRLSGPSEGLPLDRRTCVGRGRQRGRAIPGG